MADMQKLSKKNKWSLHCNFCGKDVYVSPTHVLCRHCAEEILGREFTDDDFTNAPVNYEYLDDGTRILKNTYYRKEK